MKLRPYQRACVDAALAEVRRCTDPCLIDAAPASGKSFMIAAISDALHKISGKRVLCLAPSAELVKQNHAKFLLTGEKASIFSASAGHKSTRNVVVFGTPGTVKNSISRFMKHGADGYCAVIIDECHGTTPTIKAIIESMRSANPQLRVIGLSGTPFRLGSGYIFRTWPDGKANGDDVTRDPYFMRCVYSVSAREMLDQGFITPMHVGDIHTQAYDTSGIGLLPNGQPNPDDIDRAFVGHGRRTAAIVGDVIEQSRERPGGVMLFAATVRHAQEVMASLPPERAALVTGETPTRERERFIREYRAQNIRYLVSVGTLTTGFDVAHTSTIATLRYTESAALLQQILGRAWRICDQKPDALWLDYAGNADRHFPDGDIYKPAIKAGKAGGGGELEAICPDCGEANTFTPHKDFLDFDKDAQGYCLDVFGEQIMTEYGPQPGHYGRRCFGQLLMPGGKYERCGYRWTFKPCPHCEAPNDIAARYCAECKGELIDPNQKLAIEFKAMKRDPTRPQTDRVLSYEKKDSISRAGNPTLRVDFVTEYRQFSVWFQPQGTHSRAVREHAAFVAADEGATGAGATCAGAITTISYMKDADSGFFRILAYNQPADEEPAKNETAPEPPNFWRPELSRRLSA